ncbi:MULTISPECIES: 3-deoxy-7-phosphoheptulonate synthase [Arthrobacter]|uniref:Phospho-2-dehydro-3-deoxyheptonate aldolase n=2 Tax=Arthrobacter TaxID=1663 RepID=A0ABU9KKW6_9MICC|nr:3-deoxy-7-phosphoheptulonate synthase [Arthrobacter sp. YJM1]MDP5227544.1 3-deoxy-7-phosphoheptulonate synthase [Arthrobacter sp. YJM1]
MNAAAQTLSTSGQDFAGRTAYAPLPTATELRDLLPVDADGAAVVERSRDEVRAVLNGLDDRLLVVVGPCSVHDTTAGLEYARRLAAEASRHREDLLVVMRCYFEKPRTTVGWKGLINDPGLDGGHDMARGLSEARGFLRDVTALGLPTATEFLEPFSAPYLEDLVSWGAVGARTTESQVHRQMAAALDLPMGFKNATDGTVSHAIDACQAASAAQSFLGTDLDGRTSVVHAPGNRDGHVILRGGASGPNHRAESVAEVSAALTARGGNPRVVIDASHGNSGKNHHRQAEVALEIAAQLEGERTADAIAGVMLESFLVGGAQKFDPADGPEARDELVYGQSITDACMEWDVTAQVLDALAEAVRNRRDG